MCGIAGIAVASSEVPPTERTLRCMCDTLIHRGPDEEGILVEGAVALGMRRLSIIDVKGGHQPLYNEGSNRTRRLQRRDLQLPRRQTAK